uniref:CLAVATA3/ESR-like protein n=1 Tax=Globodera rostochiensis TaxID=31243 RepID=A0A914HK52_GLORO
MAKNAMLCLLILSVVLALAFATNEKDDKEAGNHSTGIFGKAGRFVTVALAMSSRLGGAGASQGGGAVHGESLKSNQLQNAYRMALPPPMPMKSAEVGGILVELAPPPLVPMHSAEIDGWKPSPDEYLKKFAQEFRRNTGMKPQSYNEEKRVTPGGPNALHNGYVNRQSPPNPPHHNQPTLEEQKRLTPGGPNALHNGYVNRQSPPNPPHHNQPTLEEQKRVTPGGPNALHNGYVNRQSPPNPPHHNQPTLEEQKRVTPGGPDRQHR